MTTTDYIVLIGMVCGPFTVLGGLVLPYKGVVRLSEASCEEALSIEHKKIVKIKVHYPALALFAIGVAFIVVAA